jgi:hypothetical protein
MSLLPGPVGLWTAALDAVEPAAVPDVVGALDAQGWDALWFGEAYGREAFSAAQLYLSATSRMAVATGIASIYGRDAGGGVVGRAPARRPLPRAASCSGSASATRRWWSGCGGTPTASRCAP